MDKSENNLLIRPIKQITSKHFKLFLEADPSRKMVNDYVDRAYQFELVDNNELLGVLLLLDTRPETVEIVNIAVDETARNQGLGEKLILFALDWSKQHHYRTVSIGTGSTSFAQLYLYQKCGFRVISIDRDFFVDNYDAPIMENKLLLKDMIRLEKNLQSNDRKEASDKLNQAIKKIPVQYLNTKEDVVRWLKENSEDDE